MKSKRKLLGIAVLTAAIVLLAAACDSGTSGGYSEEPETPVDVPAGLATLSGTYTGTKSGDIHHNHQRYAHYPHISTVSIYFDDGSTEAGPGSIDPFNLSI
jgi:hypothetical protein